MKRACGVVFFVVLLAGAAWLGVQASSLLQAGDSERAMGFAAAALVLACVGAVAGFAVWLGTRADREARQVKRRQDEHPHDPWLWRREWAERRIEHLETGGALVLVWSIALLWLGMTVGSGALVHAKAGLPQQPGVLLVLLAFFAVGMLLLTLAVKATIRRMKYGRSVLELTSLPGVLGGELTGTILAPTSLTPEAAIHLTLDCVTRTYTMRRQYCSLVWRVEKFLATGGGSSAIPVSLAIPFDCPETTPEDPDAVSTTRVSWSLSARARTPGVDYYANFEVPVFKTEASDPTQCKTQLDAASELSAAPPSGRITIDSQSRGGTVVRLATPGWLPWWLGASVVPAVVAGLLAWLSHKQGIELLTTLGIGIGIGAGMLAITLLGVVMQPMRLTVLPDQLEIKRGMGVLGWTKRLDRAGITDVVFEGAQSGTAMIYSVEAVVGGGASHTLALGLRDIEEVRWLTGQLKLLVLSTRQQRGRS